MIPRSSKGFPVLTIDGPITLRWEMTLRERRSHAHFTANVSRQGGRMAISGVIPQLRTTDLKLKANGVALVKDVHDTPWGTREIVIRDDQGHTLYLGESR